MSPLRASVAEFVGTFALMFVGGGAMMLVDGGGLLVVALAHGLILAVMVGATIHISGAQFNPAVALALVALGKQSWTQAGIFIVAQLAGCTAAVGLLSVLLDPAAVEAARHGATLGSLSSGETASIARLAGLEIIATFFLMFVIMGTAVDPRGAGRTPGAAGFAIGLVVAADILCFGPLTGASMNPARSFGPALVGGHWEMHLVYWLAPIAGAMLAGIIYQATFGSSPGPSAVSGE